jgi:hypothetical protein
MNRMGHKLSQWIDLDRRLAGLQERPVVLKFRSVYLRPRLDQTRLRLWQPATQALVRVKMGPMMLPAGFDEHPNDDAEESGELWHSHTLASSPTPFRSVMHRCARGV